MSVGGSRPDWSRAWWSPSLAAYSYVTVLQDALSLPFTVDPRALHMHFAKRKPCPEFSEQGL